MLHDIHIPAHLVTPSVELRLLKRLKRNRSPGIDGFTTVHLNSITMSENEHRQLKDEALTADCAIFLKKFFVGNLQLISLNCPTRTRISMDQHE